MSTWCTQSWATDRTWKVVPSFLTALHSKRVGRRTEWVTLKAIYSTLLASLSLSNEGRQKEKNEGVESAVYAAQCSHILVFRPDLRHFTVSVSPSSPILTRQRRSRSRRWAPSKNATPPTEWDPQRPLHTEDTPLERHNITLRERRTTLRYRWWWRGCLSLLGLEMEFHTREPGKLSLKCSYTECTSSWLLWIK